jgi:hypothetical protein
MRILAGWRVRAGISTSTLRVGPDQSESTRTSFPDASSADVEVKVDNSVVKVTQIAFEESVIAAVYATGVYAAKGRNPTSNASDMVFADSLSSETATITGGDATSGYSAAFTVGVSI